MSLYYRRMTRCDIQWQARTPHFIPHYVLVCQSPYNELKFHQTTMLRNYMGSQSNTRCSLWHIQMTCMKYTFIMFWGTKYQLAIMNTYCTNTDAYCMRRAQHSSNLHQIQSAVIIHNWSIKCNVGDKITQRIMKMMTFVVKWQVYTLEYSHIFSSLLQHCIQTC